jgi:hypothetical protein
MTYQLPTSQRWDTTDATLGMIGTVYSAFVQRSIDYSALLPSSHWWRFVRRTHAPDYFPPIVIIVDVSPLVDGANHHPVQRSRTVEAG